MVMMAHFNTQPFGAVEGWRAPVRAFPADPAAFRVPAGAFPQLVLVAVALADNRR
jgi:hypothetical protein